jgi:hypothetical protein
MPPVTPTPYTTGRGNAYGNITNESDPMKASQQDRQFAYQGGQDLLAESGQDQNVARSERDIYNSRLKGVYDPLVSGQGGLTPQQLQQVTREQELADLNMTPDEVNNSYLSMDERQAVQGDTNNRRKYFNPNYENQIFDEGSTRERAAVGDYKSGLEGAFNPETLRPDKQFASQLNSGVDQFGSSLDAALDPNALTVSDEFLADYALTPAEQQGIITSAATTVGTRDKAAIAEAERRARAAGVNPLGVAALRNRSERERSANAADAATSAKVQADAEAAKRLQVGEAMRIGSGQTLAGLRTNAAGQLMDAGYRAATTGEGARVAGERDIADRQTYAADRSGQANMAAENDLARRKLALQQNITQVGNEAERDVDTTNAERAKYLAADRLKNEQYVQGQRYGRGAAASGALSDRYKYAADANRADASEGRGYYGQQQQQANTNYNAAADRRGQTYAQQTQAGQNATKTQAELDSRPKWYDKVIGAAIGGAQAAAGFAGGGAKGAVITKPTYALIGEDGPEMVVPLDAQNPEVLPSMAVRPGQPVPFSTAPPPPRFKSAYSQQYRYGS